MTNPLDGGPAPAAAAVVFSDALEQAEQYASILASRGIEWGLIGPREGDKLWERHLLNSVAVSPSIHDDALVVDVGSGAGLPGIPLALMRPDLRVTLLEPLERRAHFLTLAVDELGIGDRVRVVRERAEEHRQLYDVATCRAVAPVTKLLAWTTHLFSPGGRLVALKGESVDGELIKAANELKKRRLSARVHLARVHPDVEATRVLVVEGPRG
ncbi:16S rRNA (guanine(527)-N(7))-methyltransferase RsmG [Nigerium massiliense]|uniref:16S rRNA (guanine(527)-N(7))-methyltransferase RsmG n=1 Tax=Nigerium massiliense TaxID=1522317 RepID=UPI00059104A4|nr:16S rRNA (guanine(527)-N(7))-methyltransferase RsmG [Nigerium massiliense]